MLTNEELKELKESRRDIRGLVNSNAAAEAINEEAHVRIFDRCAEEMERERQRQISVEDLIPIPGKAAETFYGSIAGEPYESEKASSISTGEVEKVENERVDVLSGAPEVSTINPVTARREVQTESVETAIDLASHAFPDMIYRTDSGHAVNLRLVLGQGLSVFALDFIPKHTVLWRSPTIVLPREILSESPEFNIYAFGPSHGVSEKLPEKWYEQHHAKPGRSPVLLVCGLPQLLNAGTKKDFNVSFSSSHLRIIDFVSTKDIFEGQELRLAYGYYREHWFEKPRTSPES